MSSGAIQYGVPTSDFLRGTSLLTWAQNPKSDSFTWGRQGLQVRGARLLDCLTHTHTHMGSPEQQG